MQVAILVLLLALSASSLANPVNPKVVDWPQVLNEMVDIQNLTLTAASRMETLALDSNFEVGLLVSIILHAAVEDAEEISDEVVEEIGAETLTAGGARGYYIRFEAILVRASEEMQIPLAQLDEAVAQEIRDIFDTTELDVQFKFERIIYLLSCDDTC